MRAYRYISSKIHTAVCITNKYYRSIFTPRQHVCVSTNMHSNSSMSFKPGYLMLVSVCPVRRCCLLWSRSVARNVAHTPRPTYSCSAHLLDLVVISSMLCCCCVFRFIQEQAGSIRHGNSRHGCLPGLHRRVRRGVRPAHAPRKRDLPLPQQHEGEGDPGCSRGWSLQQVMKAKTNNEIHRGNNIHMNMSRYSSNNPFSAAYMFSIIGD